MPIEQLTPLEAYRAGKLNLPPGYELLYGAEVLLLRQGRWVGGCRVQRYGHDSFGVGKDRRGGLQGKRQGQRVTLRGDRSA